jgi:hypothetical protein
MQSTRNSAPQKRRTLKKGLMALGLLFGLAVSAHASQAYGSLNNFDCVNDTTQETHGFEIEIDYGHSTDITYTYDYNHYGKPRIYEDASDPLHVKVFVRYEAKKNPDGSWSAYTAIPTGPISPTQGHQFTDPSVNFGGEHFGVGFYGNPVSVKYNWLLDDGSGNLVHGPAVYIATPAFTYIPPAAANPPQVVAAIQQPEPAEPPRMQFGKATWVKEIKTVLHNPRKVPLRELVGDDPDKPQPWANGEQPQVEIEWRLMQKEYGKAGGGKNNELKGAPEGLPGGDETITRRYEFYQYTGPLDAETGEAMATAVARDGKHGSGSATYAHHFDFNTGEWVTVTTDMSKVIVVGDFFGAQMAGFDVKPELGLIDNIQDADFNVKFPNRRVAIPGQFPITVTVKTGSLPLGLKISPTTGILSGTPIVPGPFTFTIEASDTSGKVVSHTYTLNVLGDNIPSYSVTVSALPGIGGKVKGGGTYYEGVVRSFVATANPGYQFRDWTENGIVVSTNPTYTFAVTSNHTLVANFLRLCNITTSASPFGYGTTAGDGTYLQGNPVTLTATANAGYAFSSWTLDGKKVSGLPTYTFNASYSRAYVANFVKTYAVTVSATLGGTARGTGVYKDGQTITVKASPKIGYVFVNWTENGTQISDLASYTFTVTGERTLVANFAKI